MICQEKDYRCPHKIEQIKKKIARAVLLAQFVPLDFTQLNENQTMLVLELTYESI